MLTTRSPIDRETIHEIQRSLQGTHNAVFLDIDDTLLNPSPKWLEMVQEYLRTEFDLAEIYQKGGFYNYFTESQYRDDFLALTDELISNENFNSFFPLMDGAPEGLRTIQKTPETVLAAYLTARPDTMQDVTMQNLTELGYPRMHLVCRPEYTFDRATEEWKLEVLLEICAGFSGRLVMIDDNIRLTQKILQHNLRNGQSRLVSILLQSAINENAIAREGLASQPEYGVYVAGWGDIPYTAFGRP